MSACSIRLLPPLQLKTNLTGLPSKYMDSSLLMREKESGSTVLMFRVVDDSDKKMNKHHWITGEGKSAPFSVTPLRY